MTNSTENPLINIDKKTISAFNYINKEDKNEKAKILGVNDGTSETTPNKSAYVYVYTPQDKQKHRYFHSLSIDKEVEDFMGTAELRCPYDSDLMEYWEIIRAYCIVYGSNKGEQNAKVLFVGRVRELRQEGYELSIVLQDYGWKFKQLVTQSYANDNVLNKNGYQIMKLIFEALKIDSYSISATARYRLKQVGINSDGNLTVNKKEITEMPDLLERLKKSDPNKAINKYTITNKLREQEAANYKNINYTLKYEKPTPVMKNIASEGGGYESGGNIYSNPYASASGGGAGAAGGAIAAAASGSALGGAMGDLLGTMSAPANLCSNIPNSSVRSAMKMVWSFNRGKISSISSAKDIVKNYARSSPDTYFSKVVPCLNTLEKYTNRGDRQNGATIIKTAAGTVASMSRMSTSMQNAIGSIARMFG